MRLQTVAVLGERGRRTSRVRNGSRLRTPPYLGGPGDGNGIGGRRLGALGTGRVGVLRGLVTSVVH
ncbi:hypothetical protein [Actinocatenispora rupis]|uniref:hypothetical protein n=1 Tax=Actinocatenispora rupis TaxID=519421 RepID=UPI001942A476|nr:hypothetical protein [Actinocatenispora rupis]